MFIQRILLNSRAAFIRGLSSQASTGTTTNVPKGATASSSGINADVPGLSGNCVKSTNELVGPGAGRNAEYKVPEYFCYDKNTFFEAEIEMAKYRCPQPVAPRKP